MQAKFSEIKSLKKILSNNPVMYHKQIAIKPHHRGIGNKLLEAFFVKAAELQYQHIICLIVHEPFLNKRSIEFHQRHGFEYKGLVQIEDMKDGVYYREEPNYRLTNYKT